MTVKEAADVMEYHYTNGCSATDLLIMADMLCEIGEYHLEAGLREHAGKASHVTEPASCVVLAGVVSSLWRITNA